MAVLAAPELTPATAPDSTAEVITDQAVAGVIVKTQVVLPAPESAGAGGNGGAVGYAS